ncbi:MAG: insulinase family protein, partial [Cellvibrionaceae bacterium]|nr:insulinase family protein [Cellvibrionaceae bacterium]
EVVESERGVVTSERSTGFENSNVRLMMMELKGIGFRAHPYSWPVIGHQSDIDRWTLQDLQDFHRRYYAPNNALVVIVGDVQLANVQALAKKYFEPIAAQPAPEPVRTIEPQQKGERRSYVHKASVSAPNIMMGFHVPNTRHQDYYPLAMLSAILSGTDSARLERALIDGQLATETWAYLPESIDPNLFYIYARAASGVTAAELERTIIAELNRIAIEAPSQAELDRVKKQARVDFYRGLATINGKADTLGSYATYHGDYRKLFGAADAMAKISAADVQRVAAEYLRRANRSVVVLDSAVDSREGDR